MTHPETDLVERLRALSRHEHDDLSIGVEAADAIETLISRLERAEGVLRDLVERIDANGGLGEYKGGKPFVLQAARAALKGDGE